MLEKTHTKIYNMLEKTQYVRKNTHKESRENNHLPLLLVQFKLRSC